MARNRKEYIGKAIKDPKNAAYVIRTNFDKIAGRLLFKNTAGLKNNLEGKKLESKIKKRSIDPQHIDPSVINLTENGYANLGKPFNDSTIKQIVERYNKMIDDDKFSYVRSQYDGQVYSRAINRAHRHFPEFKNLMTEDLIKMIEQYYRGNFQIIDVTMWRIYPVPQEVSSKKEIYGSYWHCDGDNTIITTMFVNMTDTTEKDGPLHLIPIKRTKELIKMGYKSRHDYNLSQEVIEDKKYLIKHTGSPGSTAWVSTHYCLHRAGIPEEGHYRDMLQLRFMPSDEPISSNWAEKCKDNDAEVRMTKSY